MNKYILVILLSALSLSGWSQLPDAGFAIIADKRSMTFAPEEIKQYAGVLNEEGLKTVIIEDRWHNPDSIRNLLKAFYRKNKAFEGAVFIGDIPVPMIRDAQHLTSAFKMDQERYPWHRSSVPSDRFYEDFDLEFNYLRADTNGLFFYYGLKADSPQRLTPDI